MSLAGTSMGAGGMTTVWRPRVRIEVPEVDDEVEVGVEVTEEELLTKKGTKRKRAPCTKGPCEHGVKWRSSARCAALVRTVVGVKVQGVRWGINLRARSSALSVQGVRWGINLRARSSTLLVQGVRWGINLRARSCTL